MPLRLCGEKSATAKTPIFHLFQITKKSRIDQQWEHLILDFLYHWEILIGNSPSQVAKTDNERSSKRLQTGPIVAKGGQHWPDAVPEQAKPWPTLAKLANHPAVRIICQRDCDSNQGNLTMRIAMPVCVDGIQKFAESP